MMLSARPADLAAYRFEQCKRAYNEVVQRVVSGDRSPTLTHEAETARRALNEAHDALRRSVESAA